MTDRSPTPRIHVPMRVRFSDLDAYGHVNNVAALRLLEEARARVFWPGDPEYDRGAQEEFTDTAVWDSRPGETTFTVIAHQEIEYLLPIPYFKTPLDIQMWPSRIGGASAVFCYEVWGPATRESGGRDALYFRAATTLVFVDVATGRPRRLTDVERASWESYMGEPVRFPRRGVS